MIVQTLHTGEMDSNTYWLTDPSTGLCAVIDPGFPSKQLTRLADEAGEKLQYILLTHRHFDHIGAAAFYKQRTGAKVCIHAKDACGLSSGFFSLAGANVPSHPLTPDYTISEGDRIRVGESIVTVLETPGHTVGSVTFWCDGDLFTGDTLFRLGAGRTDLPTGHYEQLLASLKRLAELPGDYRVLPGHGKPSTLDVERAMNPFLSEACRS